MFIFLYINLNAFNNYINMNVIDIIFDMQCHKKI